MWFPWFACSLKAEVVQKPAQRQIFVLRGAIAAFEGVSLNVIIPTNAVKYYGGSHDIFMILQGD
ncbi:hypothetical protein ABENE_02130 [Asticcacaulis benevestitus DSM 16100 = ATCC BAA-896]|uniref:Uncharacterized protein n=1 Tax=Asticcacaulis benevestitus DSM 16100 = ATCC BAA-896 TaxID=1121022 RepID=V4Q8Y1_9CAUL|nr:hypothetical protein ABENE_02130 [Asticcacaulis benevestitus DSM 16100 = ATCC BAA-896]